MMNSIATAVAPDVDAAAPVEVREAVHSLSRAFPHADDFSTVNTVGNDWVITASVNGKWLGDKWVTAS